MIPYAELCVTSNFTFLTGASHPEELVSRAAELGLSAIAITDRNSVAGVVRAFSALKELARRWAPTVLEGVRKQSAHTALSDVRDSIEELRHYRKHLAELAEK